MLTYCTKPILALFALLSLFAFTAEARQADYSVGFIANEINSGDPIQVRWEAPSNNRSRGWIGLYSLNSNDRQYLVWQYVPDNSTSGTITFSYLKPGTYEARFFSDNGYTREAKTRDHLRIRPSSNNTGGDYKVSLTGARYAPGEPILIRWETPSGSRSQDWIGLYSPNASDRNYVAWEYIPNRGTSGTITFSYAVPGTYEARLFSGNGYNREDTSTQQFTITYDNNGLPNPNNNYRLNVTSASVNVGQSVTVNYQTPSGASRDRDWIGLYRISDSDRSYLNWQYIGSSADGSLTFTAPRAGTYEFRYFQNDGYTRLATSAPFTAGSNTVTQCTVANLNNITNYPPKNGPVVAFGDSLTAGVGATANQDYVSQLQRQAGVNIINAGVSGDTTAEALARLNRDVLVYNPSVVIIWLGGNDIISRFYERAEQGLENITYSEWLSLLALRLSGKIPEPSGITEAQTFANLREIIERIQATGAITIVVGFSGGIFNENLEGRYAAVAAATGSLYVPDALNNIVGRPSRMSDIVHPNNTGYRMVADRILPYLTCVIPR
ncbi:MAG TPA: GDSL-type esterase/lipase family protein [Candidatus Paceibacterota bacterium]|nr:GDSL-type esterase/lipase family protein [Candidatus Paceibacterota bacterium]HMO82903.1 GDSL-type esterase/lipase family protein [Candidatus Paceibacterota bacterium]